MFVPRIPLSLSCIQINPHMPDSHLEDTIAFVSCPPNLRTLIWSPPWTVRPHMRSFVGLTRSHFLRPRYKQRPSMQQFTEAAFAAKPTLREVMYETQEGTWCRHALTPDGVQTSTDRIKPEQEAWARGGWGRECRA